MRLVDRRSRLQRLRDNTALDVPSAKATKAGLIAATGAALIAASAGISSRRRRGT
jgi:hypothetical protein